MNSNSLIPDDAIECAERGEIITAIKIVRERTGLGLAEARAAVDGYLKGTANLASAPAPDDPEIPRRAVVALENGRLIEAVKQVREANGLGLKDSKERVERYLNENDRVRARFESASSASLRGVVGKVVVVLGFMGLATCGYLYAIGYFR